MPYGYSQLQADLEAAKSNLLKNEKFGKAEYNVLNKDNLLIDRNESLTDAEVESPLKTGVQMHQQQQQENAAQNLSALKNNNKLTL